VKLGEIAVAPREAIHYILGNAVDIWIWINLEIQI